jgi:hypothetical protein
MAGMLCQFFGQVRHEVSDCLGKRLVSVGAPDEMICFVV